MSLHLIYSTGQQWVIGKNRYEDDNDGDEYWLRLWARAMHADEQKTPTMNKAICILIFTSNSNSSLHWCTDHSRIQQRTRISFYIMPRLAESHRLPRQCVVHRRATCDVSREIEYSEGRDVNCIMLCQPGLTYIFNLRHSGTLALTPERQSARMWEIKNVT